MQQTRPNPVTPATPTPTKQPVKMEGPATPVTPNNGSASTPGQQNTNGNQQQANGAGNPGNPGNRGGRGKMGGGRGGRGAGGGGRGNPVGGGGRFQGRNNAQGNNNNNNQGQQGNEGGGGGRKWQDHDGHGPKMSEDRMLLEKLASLSNSTVDLPIRQFAESKFSGRSRLYVGNLGSEITEADLKEHFAPYGEIAEVFLNKEKGFAFVRVDYRSNSERAKRELDGKVLKGRTLRVRSAPHSAAIRVKNLSPFVTNELLEKAFSIFGDIERAIVVANERGQSTNEGIVEFVRKPGAQAALRRCSEGCFFLTSSLRPVVVEPMEQLDDEDGFSERAFAKKTADFLKEREAGPRFADPNSFQFTYGQRWKQLLELYKQKKEAVDRELQLEEDKLISQMEYARYEHETEMLREQLRQREMDRERQKRDWEMKERQREESRLREEETLRRQSEEMTHRLRQQEDEMRRRQSDNSMFIQDNQSPRGGGGGQGNQGVGSLQQSSGASFDRPGLGQGGQGGPGSLGMGNNGPLNLMDLPMENKPFHSNSFDRPMEPPPMFNNNLGGGRMDGGPGPAPRGPPHGGGGPHGPPAQRWGRPGDNHRDDFAAKRRRF